jgi:foldase protein PrsA
MGGEEQFAARLADTGMTENELKEQIRKSLLFQKIYSEVTKDVQQISDDQAQQYYNDNPSLFQKPDSLKVRHILVADEATAQQLKARLDAGEDFATLAKQYSTDPGSKDKGGDLGEVPTQNSGFVPEFEEAMAALKAGETSGPVKTTYGYHIIRVDSIVPGGQQTYEDVRDEMKQGLLLENQRKVFEDWSAQARNGYQINIAPEYKA